jgi:3-mercaptopyruvate sulfurtransferase SseA
MESKANPVFIDSATLESLLKEKVAGADIRILNCTGYSTPEEGDPVLAHCTKRITGAEFLDLRYLRDMTKPYPNMFPTEKQFIDLMKARGIKLSTKVVLYDSKVG